MHPCRASAKRPRPESKHPYITPAVPPYLLLLHRATLTVRLYTPFLRFVSFSEVQNMDLFLRFNLK